MKTDEVAVAAPPILDPTPWEAMFGQLTARIAGRFPRVEPRRTAADVIRGLMAELPRKNAWTIAEHAGHATPDRVQHLLNRGRWDHDGAIRDLREYVVEQLGEAFVVLVVDETGDVKKGDHSVGVQRQFTGTAGRIENAQVGVYLAYATDAGHAFVDRRLYLPESWCEDPERMAAAAVPDDVAFKTKPALATEMIEEFCDSGARVDFATGDEVYGADPRLRTMLEERGIGHVLAISCAHRVGVRGGVLRADQVAAVLPSASWQVRSAADGVKGRRWYDWALIDLAETSAHGGVRQMLIRRNRATGELAFYRCWSQTPVPLTVLVKVAGRRWAVEECFQTGKGLTGLDEHQVRRWTSWQRWTVLAMLAHAFLTIAALTEHRHHPAPDDMVPITRNEFARLFAALVNTPSRTAHTILAWSSWRRRRQRQAQIHHWRRRGDYEL